MLAARARERKSLSRRASENCMEGKSLLGYAMIAELCRALTKGEGDRVPREEWLDELEPPCRVTTTLVTSPVTVLTWRAWLNRHPRRRPRDPRCPFSHPALRPDASLGSAHPAGRRCQRPSPIVRVIVPRGHSARCQRRASPAAGRAVPSAGASLPQLLLRARDPSRRHRIVILIERVWCR